MALSSLAPESHRTISALVATVGTASVAILWGVFLGCVDVEVVDAGSGRDGIRGHTG